MRLGFFLREATRSLRRSAVPSFAAMATVLVTMLVLGVFIPVVQATTGAANEIRGKLLLDVYLKPTATKADAARVKGVISDRTPNVKSVTFISKQQAYQQQVKRNPEAYRLLGRNPLPDTFRIVPRDPGQIDQIADALEPKGPSGARAPVDPSIDQVKNRRDETSKILSATRVVKLSMALLAVLLIAASVLLIANTIRLSLFARRREVEVMRLVGATNWFIRWPFVIEGIIVGALGGVMAILLLAVGKIALIDPLADDFALIAAPKTVSFAVLIGVLLAASVGVSAAGSGLSLRRFLRV
jgi:cell division transport system permease protein